MQFLLNPTPESSSPRISGPFTRPLIEEMLASGSIPQETLAQAVGSTAWLPVHEALELSVHLPTEKDFAPLIKLLLDHPALVEQLFRLETLPPSTRVRGLFSAAHELGLKKIPLPKVFSHLTNPLVYSALIGELKKIDWN
jgi:hypothetical protein